MPNDLDAKARQGQSQDRQEEEKAGQEEKVTPSPLFHDPRTIEASRQRRLYS
jgi:hypothetical protein